MKIKTGWIYMKIYNIEDLEYDDDDQPNIIYSIHFASSIEKCINFLKRALEDQNSGIEETSIIQITEEELDEYFGEINRIGRKTVSEWIK